MVKHYSDLDLSKQYTFKDYFSWQFQESVELYRGFITKMSPAPNTAHQEYSGNIYTPLKNFLKNKKSKTFFAPIDVYLPTIDKNTVVQPDIIVVNNLAKIQKKGCAGAPDIVVEILLPGNSKKEMNDKYNLYEEAGVKVYWVVFPEEQVVQIYEFTNGRSQSKKPLANGNKITTPILKSLELEVDEIFARYFFSIN